MKKPLQQEEIPMPEEKIEFEPGTNRKIIEVGCEGCGRTFRKPEDNPVVLCGDCITLKLRQGNVTEPNEVRKADVAEGYEKITITTPELKMSIIAPKLTDEEKARFAAIDRTIERSKRIGKYYETKDGAFHVLEYDEENDHYIVEHVVTKAHRFMTADDLGTTTCEESYIRSVYLHGGACSGQCDACQAPCTLEKIAQRRNPTPEVGTAAKPEQDAWQQEDDAIREVLPDIEAQPEYACDFCGKRHLKTALHLSDRLLGKICRACAAKALYRLIPLGDPDITTLEITLARSIAAKQGFEIIEKSH